MAEVEVTINGVLFDKTKMNQPLPVVLVGSAYLTNVGIGGGPIIPGQQPPGIWGPNDPRPQPPIPIYPGGTPNPPGIWGPNDPRPTPPIFIPPNVPPDMQPPTTPPPGSVTPVPPPEGSGGWPVTGIVPPPYIVVYYPGVGPVTVTPPPQPDQPQPTQQSSGRRG